MTVKSLRIPEDMEKAIEYVAKLEKIEKSQSLRKLTRIGFECYVARSYERGKLTLREAAKLLKLPLSETIDILSEMGVKGNIGPSEVLESLRANR
jgi:predicted HTH domain antitoxin